MKRIIDNIKSRRSVRTFSDKPLNGAHLQSIEDYIKDVPNPYGIQVDFKLLDAKTYGLKCPVQSGATLYIGGKVKECPNSFEAFGYSFERLVLFSQSIGVGTVWLGGTLNRSAFEKAMELSDGELMPCATPIGYPAKKMSLRESVMRKVIGADDRLPFEELFFSGDFEAPLSKETAGELYEPLEAVRLAPSAVNKQPWRVVVTENEVHFYLKRDKAGSAIDMQKIDMGIALCHFHLTALQMNINLEFCQRDPQLEGASKYEYIASFKK